MIYSIRQAKVEESELLLELALRSKSHWKYDEDYLNACRPALLIDAEYIQNWPVKILEIKKTAAAYYSLKAINGENRLDHLWIDLPYIRQGLGKDLLFHAFETAQQLGWSSFRLAGEPGAQAFYEKFGAKHIGTVQSRIKPDLFLPHLEFKF